LADGTSRLVSRAAPDGIEGGGGTFTSESRAAPEGRDLNYLSYYSCSFFLLASSNSDWTLKRVITDGFSALVKNTALLRSNLGERSLEHFSLPPGTKEK
jgi:hypothetical protein